VLKASRILLGPVRNNDQEAKEDAMRTTTLALLVTAAMATTAGAADLSKQAPAAAPAPDSVKRAELMAARQDWPDAIEAYRAAIAASPQSAALYNRLGICYQRMGDPRAAREAYRKAIKLDKDYAVAHNNLGTIEHAAGRYKQAVAAYSKAIKLDANDAVFYKNLGSAWLARGQVEKALEAWGEAIRLDPVALDSAAVTVPASGVSIARQYYLYAKLLAARGETEKALEYLTKAQAAGFSEFAKVERDSDFAAIVKDPRYAALK
jgi:tetratricopeptide (TPR) repeat protein